MDKIKNLNHYQKALLLIMLVMTLIFAPIYHKTVSKIGYEYRDEVLVQSVENGNTVYSGKIDGEQAQFTVTEDGVVSFEHGDKSYGPYTMIQDPTAIPEDEELRERMSGVEIREGEEILFRGGILDLGDTYWMYNEDGTLDTIGIFYVSNGVERDENGNEIDRMEPSAYTIYELMNGPELTHRGEGIAWFGAVLVCIFNVISILYADELFRWNLAFQIRNVDKAEPSDWEIAGRYIGWTFLAIMALIAFIMGLQ
ncbi:MAG: hypothetical protein IJB09_07085 [Oscillospiraceae bacterium]|nr:hypothetical protein [Oscillospiraceae bacterium]